MPARAGLRGTVTVRRLRAGADAVLLQVDRRAQLLVAFPVAVVEDPNLHQSSIGTSVSTPDSSTTTLRAPHVERHLPGACCRSAPP